MINIVHLPFVVYVICEQSYGAKATVHMNKAKVVLYKGKLKEAQCSEPVKSRVPSIWLVWKENKTSESLKRKSWAPGATGLC